MIPTNLFLFLCINKYALNPLLNPLSTVALVSPLLPFTFVFELTNC